MRVDRPAPASRRHLAWLLWLALLLPLAQTAANWHALSHAAASAIGGETDSDSKALHATSCALCLSAAVVGSGALPSAPASLLLPTGSHAAPQAADHGASRAADWPAYQSRAPPTVIPC
ncbi:MAG TPA: hypothetical protein VFY73_17965 [Ideonella sp.]|uniref:hypothetical protein n=1 Tax=Ideonella sp. TaxID=1929293 RepID=UPI002E305445|nr:hypothetical protein [Ideonella sp.]HEX5685915.1 hypothetical protein [Ideonella sp.]